MTRIISVLLLAAVAVTLVSCSGSTLTQGPVLPNIAGAWEFMANSSTTVGSLTGIEVALKEGQSFSNGNYQPNGEISADGNAQIAFVSIDPATINIRSFGGACPVTDGTNRISGSLTGLAGAVSNFTLTQNGNVFNVTATLAGDGRSMLGTYESAPGSACTDSGTFTGTVVSKLAGIYTGPFCRPLDLSCEFPADAVDTATATLSQSGTTMTLSLAVTGADNAAFTLSGPVTGNAFTVTGTFQGETVIYQGFYELTLNCLTQNIDLPSVYLANPAAVSDGNPSGQVALLTAPQTQVCP